MRKLIILLLPFLLISCHHSDVKFKKLQDTLAVLRKKADFKPLRATDAYTFINKYYLPSLDSFPTKRRLLIYPLKSEGFHKQSLNEKANLEADYNGDTNKKVIIPPPLVELVDTLHQWDKERLVNTTLINDSLLINESKPGYYYSREEWRKRYGVCYMCISWPVYNQYRKQILIKERYQSGWLGDHSYPEVIYTKTANGWRRN